MTIAKTLDRAAKKVGVNFIGGYTALVSKGMTPAEELLIRSIPQALASTERVCSSVNVGSTKTGINMDAVKLMGEIVLETAQATRNQDSLGCAKLVVFCNAPDDNPFMAGAFHGVTEADAIINVGVSGPGVVKTALEKVRGEDFETLCEMIKRTAFKVTRVGQLVAREASKMLGVPFGIVDLSLAPTPAIGDSVAEILEEIGLERAGAPGTTAALALLNDQVKKGGVMASTAVGGLSGAFIPVSEDQGMIDAVTAGALTIEKLEAMTCVCSVGLDMIAVPGDTKASTISGIIADEAAIGMVNQKTTAVRLIPVIGKGVGETVEFGGLLGYAPIMPVNNFLAMNPQWLEYLNQQTILTPHMGEMSRLTGRTISGLKADPAASAWEFAKKTGCVCVLKDACTTVADGDGSLYLNLSGNCGMATAGSGDVLSGMIAAVLCMYLSSAEKQDISYKTALAVYIHGLCGDIAREKKGTHSMTAKDMIEALPEILKLAENLE